MKKFTYGMRSGNAIRQLLAILLLSFLGLTTFAQQEMQYFRYNDKTGLNVFETSKHDTTSFTKMHVKVGANFEMTYQSMADKNTASPLTQSPYVGNVNSLESLTPGFVLPSAN